MQHNPPCLSRLLSGLPSELARLVARQQVETALGSSSSPGADADLCAQAPLARRRRRVRRTTVVRLRATLVGATLMGLAASACTFGGSAVPGAAPDAIRVGSFDFPESVLLANLYAAALQEHGYRVRVMPNVGARELVGPALALGLVDLVPEYQGSALAFFGLAAHRSTVDGRGTHAALAGSLAPLGIVPLAAALAENANAVVVTAKTAAQHKLGAIGDLRALAPRMVFGGPPECPQRPLCLPGLGSVYGLHFKAFVPLDSGGPLTLQALVTGEIDVAEFYTTDPAINEDSLVVLADDRGLQPAENVTPVIRRDVLARYGTGLATRIDAVSSRLTTAELRGLNAQAARGRPVADVAARWLDRWGLG
jgi:osmoprotectant transport system substrate-binding protein